MKGSTVCSVQNGREKSDYFHYGNFELSLGDIFFAMNASNRKELSIYNSYLSHPISKC
jgi:hypothetical protein